jgi:hypothetical protein
MICVMLPDWLTGVQIETSPVPCALDGAVTRGVLWQAAPGRYLLDVPETARYLVERGRRISIEPSSLAADADVRLFFRMSPLAALLFQRGILAFHAAAVAGSQGAVLIAGDSGVGKSTLIATLLKRGWSLLSDDLTAVDVNENLIPLVFPAFPELTLWPDAMENLEIENVGNVKRTLIMQDRFVASPQPLQAIFQLSVHQNETVAISDLKGATIFQSLTTLSYNSRIADALLDRTAYLRKATVIARDTSIFRLKRPRSGWCAHELADLIEKQCR